MERKSVLMTGEFWMAAGERAISTFAQAFLAIVGVEAVAIDRIEWRTVLAVSATAAVLSVAKSLAASNFGKPGPSFGPEELIPRGDAKQ